MELEAGSHAAVYKVSCTEEDVGRMVKHSKTRITWNFVANGGRSHTVSLAWSKTTGKQEIRMDGGEIWFGWNKGRSVLEHHWTTRDESLKLHVLATCAPKMNQDFRNHDLLINGQLFASLPDWDEDGSGAFRPPGNHNYHNNALPNSIIRILYPEGYTPPFGKNLQKELPQVGRRVIPEDSMRLAPTAVHSAIAPPGSNGVLHPQMVDLLT
jgi:hypothetical protein